jgi:bifunctional ADP-heptose synthase (sugar kinase/adenylyltransferase)
MSALYPAARQGFLTGAIDADTAVIKAALVRGYTYSAGHVYMSDVTGAGGTVAATATLTTITTTSGTLDSADLSFGAVAANANNHYVVLYQASRSVVARTWPRRRSASSHTWIRAGRVSPRVRW